jgi:serine/threonine protein kinase
MFEMMETSMCLTQDDIEEDYIIGNSIEDDACMVVCADSNIRHARCRSSNKLLFELIQEQSGILAVELVCDFVGEDSYLQVLCKDWAVAVTICRASRGISHYNPSIMAESITASMNVNQLRQCAYRAWEQFLDTNHAGKFLSDGACKQVFAVMSGENQLQAVSVMDLLDLSQRGQDVLVGVLQNELAISIMCSRLVTLGVCPCLPLISRLFTSPFPVPSKLWDNSDSSFDDLKRLNVNHAAVEMKKMYAASELRDIKYDAKALSCSVHGDVHDMTRYQYICMEFCDLGDAESYLKKLEPAVPLTFGLHNIQCALFQMCFSLFSAREQLQLRHFDVKLLNYFASSGLGLLTQAELENYNTCKHLPLVAPKGRPTPVRSQTRFNDINMIIHLGAHSFTIPLQTNGIVQGVGLVKLADFGTSHVMMTMEGEGSEENMDSYGQSSIDVAQFTTLENTPPEFLLGGSTVTQMETFTQSADVWCLGLCALHLLTMCAVPYEELLAECVCPTYLLHKLRRVWEFKRYSGLRGNCSYLFTDADLQADSVDVKMFAVIADVIDSLIDEEEVPEDDVDIDIDGEDKERYGDGNPCRTLYDTIYRYIVLLGVHRGNGNGEQLVFRVLQDALVAGLNGNNDDIVAGAGNRRAQNAFAQQQRGQCRAQFARDHAKWNIQSGTHMSMQRLRANLSEIGGNATDTFFRMLSLDSTNR